MDDAKAVMRKMVEMLDSGNVDSVESVVAADYIDRQGHEDVAGPEAFRNLVRALHTSRDEAVSVRIEDLIGEGDRAAARLRWHHTNTDGAVVERETIDIVRCLDGRAVEHWGAEVLRR